jgi:hypothetical protein
MRYERSLDLAVKLKRMMFSMRCNLALLPIALIVLLVIGAEHLSTGISIFSVLSRLKLGRVALLNLLNS